MTHDETRDELARMDGWDAYDASNGIRIWRRGSFFPEEGQRYYKHSPTHPHPPTLDGANAAVPEGYEWERDHCVRDGKWCFLWWAHNDTTHDVIGPVPDTGNPMDDLYALALACRRAMEEKK